jgi:hypothetical protein
MPPIHNFGLYLEYQEEEAVADPIKKTTTKMLLQVVEEIKKGQPDKVVKTIDPNVA